MSFEPNHYQELARQALRRDLSQAEINLASALEDAFAKNIHTPENVAEALNVAGTVRPSGQNDPWTHANLVEELATINASLDEAYLNAPPINRYTLQRRRQGE